MKTASISGFGRINWAITAPDGELVRVATSRGAFTPERSGKNEYYLCRCDDAEPDSYHLSGHFVGPDREGPAVGRHAYRLYVRPGFAFRLKGKKPAADAAERELRFGGEHAHEFAPDQAEVELPRTLWRDALKAGGMKLSRQPPRISRGTVFEEHDEDHEGSLIWNRLTKYYQRRPDGDCDLDAGLYFNRHGQWAGAASDDSESFPDLELRLFFAALPTWQRQTIARLLSRHEFSAVPSGRHWDGEYGIKLCGQPAQAGQHWYARRHGFDPFRGASSEAITEGDGEALSDAGHYLSTLFPGRTSDQDTMVLKQLQAVECGLERFKRPKEKVRAWAVVDDGGRMSISGHNHGTRLLKLLRVGRGDEVIRRTLQRRWAKLLEAGKVRWEASELFVLAADHGIACYPSRRWAADALLKERTKRLQDAAASRKSAEDLRIATERRQAQVAARTDDDVFSIVPDGQSQHHFRLQVSRGGEVVESYVVCREGTRLFCGKSGCSIAHTYRRHELRAVLAKLLPRTERQPWLRSHNFQYLFSELGLMAA